MLETRRLKWTMLLTAALMSSCATTKKSSTVGDAAAPGSESSVEITYSLGGAKHRFQAAWKSEAAIAQAYLDRQKLKEATIERTKYLSFLEKASRFVQEPRRTPAEDGSCRGPFTVVIRVGEQTQSTQGCRSSDTGELSRLVKDGEFLLLSPRASQ